MWSFFCLIIVHSRTINVLITQFESNYEQNRWIQLSYIQNVQFLLYFESHISKCTHIRILNGGLTFKHWISHNFISHNPTFHVNVNSFAKSLCALMKPLKTLRKLSEMSIFQLFFRNIWLVFWDRKHLVHCLLVSI